MQNIEQLTADQRADEVRKVVASFKGKKIPKFVSQYNDANHPFTDSYSVKHAIMSEIKNSVKMLDALRTGDKDNRAVDISFHDFIAEKWGFNGEGRAGMDAFYATVGINPTHDSVQSLTNMSEMPDGYRWLVPEIYREAIREGLRQNPIYPALIAGEETITQPSIIMPAIKLSNAEITSIGEAETIGTGTVDFDQRSVSVSKIGTGLKLTDEIVQFVSLNLLSIYMQDFGLKLGIGLDALALNTLINGDQADGSQAAPVVGVDTVGTTAYKDLLRAWIRMGRIGRTPSAMISDEEQALDTLLLEEFKGIYAGRYALADLNLKTPIPSVQDYYIHGVMPEGLTLLVNKPASLIKLNVGAMKLESERIVENQVTGTYVTMTTGFANLFRDGRLIINSAEAYAGFPDYMDIDAYQNDNILLKKGFRRNK